jgi:hypothetical protein
MKKIFSILAAVLVYTGAANAQQVASNNGNGTTVSSNESSDASCYCCPKGDYCSNKAGTCALHINVNLVKDGEYYCPVEDNITGAQSGTCPISGKEMKQMHGQCSAGMNNSQGSDDKNNKKSKNNNTKQDQGTTGDSGK